VNVSVAMQNISAKLWRRGSQARKRFCINVLLSEPRCLQIKTFDTHRNGCRCFFCLLCRDVGGAWYLKVLCRLQKGFRVFRNSISGAFLASGDGCIQIQRRVRGELFLSRGLWHMQCGFGQPMREVLDGGMLNAPEICLEVNEGAECVERATYSVVS
jgi:hypothetical protein